MRQASSTNLPTRRHPEQAQAFATRRPANEGSVHSHPANKIQPCHPEQSEGSAVLSIRKPGCPTSRAFRDVGVGSRQDPSLPKHFPLDSVIPRTLSSRAKSRDLLSAGTQQQPPFGKSVAQSGAPHLALFEMWVRQASATSQPAVILSKRRPSQREGLPTKDPCTPPCR